MSAQITSIPIPYSEHSSFLELAMFVTSLQIGRIIPTVNVGNPKAREEMKSWFEIWERDRVASQKANMYSKDNDEIDNESFQHYLSQEAAYMEEEEAEGEDSLIAN